VAVSKIIPGKLTADRIDGKLLGPIDIEKIYFANEDLSLSVDTLHLEWKPKRLLLGRMPISVLDADNIKIDIKKSSDDSSKLDLKDTVTTLRKSVLPALLSLEEARLTKILLQQEGFKPVEFTKVILQSHSTNNDIESLKFELSSKQAKVSVQGSLKEQWDLHWDLNISNFGLFFKEMGGSLVCKGKIYGERDNPEIETDIKAKNFRYDDLSFTAFHGDIYVDWSQKKKSKFRFLFNSPKVDLFRCNRLNFSGTIAPIRFKEAFDFDLNIAKTTIFFPVGSGSQSLNLKEGRVHGSFNNKGLATKTVFLFKDSDPVSIELKLPKLKSFTGLFDDQPLSGKINWQTKKLGFLQTLIPKIANSKGVLNASYVVSGTLQNPKADGGLKLYNASFQIPELNIGLKNVELNIKNVYDKISYQGVMDGDKGRLNIFGKALLSKEGINGKVNVDGNDFLISNTKQYRVVVSSKLMLQIDGDNLDLTGDLSIPEAVIKPTDFNIDSELPKEIVYVGQEKKKKAHTMNLQTDIGVSLGDEVLVDIMGLKGKVKGKLQIMDTPKKATTAVGGLHIKDGSYDMYGQQLKITKGDLRFIGGAVTNPEVTLEAVRNFRAANVPISLKSPDQGLTVGVRISGMLNDPKIYLFSIPGGLSNPDILSYLIIGRPSDQASGSKAQLLLQAATALNFGGTSEIGSFIGTLREKLGFSEFGFSEETSFNGSKETMLSKKSSKPGESLTTHTVFVLGRFLTPKIYVSYSMGLIDDSNVFRVKYYINKYFSVQSDSSSTGDNALDFIYTIEH